MGHPTRRIKKHSTISDHQDPVADEMFGQYCTEVFVSVMHETETCPSERDEQVNIQ